MSNIWQRVSKQNPCPICKAPDWCQFGDRAMKCMRVESQHLCASGGWYHFYDEGAIKARDFIPKHQPPPRAIDAQGIMKRWRDRTSAMQFRVAASSLGVLAEALIGLGAAWADEYRAWAFPMKDATGHTVGIRLRDNKGFKWAVSGSRQGVFMPEPSVKVGKVAFLPEGPTDTAAALSIGLYAIGRPSSNAGNDILKAALQNIGIHQVVVVSDNDELKKRLDGSEWRPGIEGAQKLKKELRLNSVIWIPTSPCKDLRKYVQAGGTAAMIESDLRNKVWSKQ